MFYLKCCKVLAKLCLYILICVKKKLEKNYEWRLTHLLQAFKSDKFGIQISGIQILFVGKLVV